jgi:hypothetical protein
MGGAQRVLRAPHDFDTQRSLKIMVYLKSVACFYDPRTVTVYPSDTSGDAALAEGTHINDAAGDDDWRKRLSRNDILAIVHSTVKAVKAAR